MNKTMSLFELIACDTYEIVAPPAPRFRMPKSEEKRGRKTRKRIARLRQLGVDASLISPATRKALKI
jgi:hypothetical protein